MKKLKNCIMSHLERVLVLLQDVPLMPPRCPPEVQHAVALSTELSALHAPEADKNFN